MRKMRKVKFLGGLLATALVAGFTFTSCDEEDLSVAVDNVTVTPSVDVTVSTGDTNTNVELNLEDGVVYVTLNAVNTKGVAVNAYFTVNDGDIYSGYATTLTFTEAADLEIIASADNYVTGGMSVTVPSPTAGTAIVLPATITLTTVEEEDVVVEEGAVSEETTEEVTEVGEATTETDEDGNITVTMTVSTADATTYLTDEQIEAFNSAIDALEGPTSASTRALSELETAKEVLKAQVKELPTAPGVAATLTYTIVVSDAASVNATISVTKKVATVALRLSYTIGANEYAVDGEGSQVVENVVEYTVEATGADGNTHTHSHSHSDSSTSGGGTAE